MKTCTRCKIEKQATPECFHRNKNHKDGLANECKECAKKRKQKFYQKNKEKILEDSRNHYQENKGWYAEYYQENKEEKLEYSRKYYEENRGYYREYSRKYRQDNKEETLEYNKKYRQDNPEVYRLHQKRRRKRMAQLPHDLTLEEWEDALEFFNDSCAYCGVSDDTVGKEHIIPVVKGGGYTADNIIPSCKSCNSSKHTSDMEEWYVKHEHYDEGRLNKILDYIEINN